MQGEFFPASDRPELLVSLTLPQNVSRAQTHRDVLKFEAKLRDNPDIDHYSSYIGSGAVRFICRWMFCCRKRTLPSWS